MAKRFTVDELKSMGMDDAQIGAIMATYKSEDDKSVKASTVVEGTHKRQKRDYKPMEYIQEFTVTTASDLQSYSKGNVIRLPDFSEGQPFIARVRRPSMLSLAKQGKIPNTLLVSANELFAKGGSGVDKDNDNMLSDIYDIVNIICEAALVEPTYKQIKDAGIELSDNQLMAIFNYTQTGVKALESFR